MLENKVATGAGPDDDVPEARSQRSASPALQLLATEAAGMCAGGSCSLPAEHAEAALPAETPAVRAD